MTQLDFFTALANGAKWGVPATISRSGSANGGLPIDAYSIFDSKAKAELYASQDKAAVEAAGMVNNAYVGQIITVWEKVPVLDDNGDPVVGENEQPVTVDDVSIYYIDADRTLKPVGDPELSGRITDLEIALNGSDETAGLETRVAAMETFWDATEDSDDIVNKLREIQNYIESDASGATTMTGNIQANADAIAVLTGDVSTAGSVDKKIADAIAPLATTEALNGVAAAAQTASQVDTAITTALSNANLAQYAVAETVNAVLDRKVDTATIAHTSENVSEGVTVEGTTLKIVVDAYKKSETYTKSEVDTAITNKISAMTGGESAADVLAALNDYKKANDTEIYGSEKVASWTDDKGKYTPVYTQDSRIDTVAAAVKANADTIIALIGSDSSKSIRDIAADETAKIVAGADTAYDTLKEIADFIKNDKTGVAAMSNDIAALKTAVDIEDKTVTAYVADQLATIVQPKSSAEISVATTGELGIKEVNVNKLVQTAGDTLILNGGNASIYVAE